MILVRELCIESLSTPHSGQTTPVWIDSRTNTIKFSSLRESTSRTAFKEGRISIQDSAVNGQHLRGRARIVTH